jgi:Barstar (barnase inhibitor)
MIGNVELRLAEHLDIPPQRVIYEKCVHVLRTSSEELSALRWVATSRSYHWFQANMSAVESKHQFFDLVGRAGSFPPSWGRNWDAFEDSLKDLTWLTGRWYMFLLEDCDRFVRSSLKEFRTATEIFVSASDYWWERRVPLHLFLTGADPLFSLDYGGIAHRICLHADAATPK